MADEPATLDYISGFACFWCAGCSWPRPQFRGESAAGVGTATIRIATGKPIWVKKRTATSTPVLFWPASNKVGEPVLRPRFNDFQELVADHLVTALPIDGQAARE